MSTPDGGRADRHSRFSELANRAEANHAKLAILAERLPARRAAEAKIRVAAASGQTEKVADMYVEYLAEFYTVEAIQKQLHRAQADGMTEAVTVYQSALDMMQS